MEARADGITGYADLNKKFSYKMLKAIEKIYENASVVDQRKYSITIQYGSKEKILSYKGDYNLKVTGIEDCPELNRTYKNEQEFRDFARELGIKENLGMRIDSGMVFKGRGKITEIGRVKKIWL